MVAPRWMEVNLCLAERERCSVSHINIGDHHLDHLVNSGLHWQQQLLVYWPSASPIIVTTRIGSMI